MVTDNGPQFASREFAEFAKQWEFLHVTSSPYHPKSNGKAESAVKVVKNLFKKAQKERPLANSARLQKYPHRLVYRQARCRGLLQGERRH